LRVGRLLIPFLHKEHYFGIEPNEWLVRNGIEQELDDEGQDFRGRHTGCGCGTD